MLFRVHTFVLLGQQVHGKRITLTRASKVLEGKVPSRTRPMINSIWVAGCICWLRFGAKDGGLKLEEAKSGALGAIEIFEKLGAEYKSGGYFQ